MRGGGVDSYFILIFAIAQKQITTLCEMRKAKLWPPLWASKFHDIVGNNEYYNERGTQDNIDGDCWTIHQFSLPLLVEKTVYVWQFIWMFEAQCSRHGALLHSHIVLWLKMACQRALTSFTMSHLYLAKMSIYICILSSFLNHRSFMTNYKINTLTTLQGVFCMFGWRYNKALKRNSTGSLEIWHIKI